MAISAVDIKKLWGNSAGQCAYPACNNPDCLPYLDAATPTIVGEMAHVIADSPSGPRGDGTGGDDTYENLVLLCPTHHTHVDKAPEGTFTAKMLFKWKEEIERRRNEYARSPHFESRNQLFTYCSDLLTANRTCWKTYGPESEEAKSNPFSNASDIWELRKLSVIVPNNAKIGTALQTHRELMSSAENDLAAEFIEHAKGFEMSCYVRKEGVPKFPARFGEFIYAERK